MLQLHGGITMPPIVGDEGRERVRAAQKRLSEAVYEEEIAFAMLRKARAERERASDDVVKLLTELTRERCG